MFALANQGIPRYVGDEWKYIWRWLAFEMVFSGICCRVIAFVVAEVMRLFGMFAA